MKKGEIWNVNLSPVKGNEQAGRRPVVIVSGNLLNTYAPVCWICPLTTKLKNYKGDVILQPSKLNGLTKKSEILVMQLRSISNDRFEKKIGEISKTELAELREGIQETLHMD